MQKYDITIRILHWTLAVALLGMIGFGWWLESLPKDDPSKLSYILLHKSFGITVLILAIGRVIMRCFTKAPPLPSTLSKTDKGIAHFGHFLLYILIIVTPLSGYVMSMASIYGVEWHGIKLYNYIGMNLTLAQTANQIHTTAPYILLGLIVLHICAVLKHRFLDKPPINLLPRISLRKK